MTLDDTILRIKDLIGERERIDRELSVLFGLTEQPPKRGRPRKDHSETTVGTNRSDTTKIGNSDIDKTEL